MTANFNSWSLGLCLNKSLNPVEPTVPPLTASDLPPSRNNGGSTPATFQLIAFYIPRIIPRFRAIRKPLAHQSRTLAPMLCVEKQPPRITKNPLLLRETTRNLHKLLSPKDLPTRKTPRNPNPASRNTPTTPIQLPTQTSLHQPFTPATHRAVYCAEESSPNSSRPGCDRGSARSLGCRTANTASAHPFARSSCRTEDNTRDCSSAARLGSNPNSRHPAGPPHKSSARSQSAASPAAADCSRSSNSSQKPADP